MSSEKTRAELQAEIEDLRERLSTSRAKEAPTLDVVPEATALASCIRAIDKLENTRGNSSSLSYGYGGGRRDQTATERVLRSLAGKYQIELFHTEIREQSCSRRHLDEISPDQVMYALRSAEPQHF